MPTDKKLNTLVLNVMTEEQYNSATKNEDELYLTPDNSNEINLYTHNITLISGENTLYFSILSSNNSSISSLTELNTLIGTTNRKINCSGTMVNQGNTYDAIHTIDYKGALLGSDLLYTDYNNGEDYQPFGSTFNTSTMSINDIVISI